MAERAIRTNSSFTNRIVFFLKIFTPKINISMKSLGFFSKVLTRNRGLFSLLS